MSENELDKDEMEALSEIIDEFEGTFDEDVAVSIFNYDDEYVDLEAEYEDESTEQFKIPRKVLLDDIPVEEKINYIN